MAVKYGLSEQMKGEWRHASCGSCGGNEIIGQTKRYGSKKNLQRMTPERAHEQLPYY
jgi:hypothetical protein